MNKKIILAICGKSSTGKDSLSKWLSKTFDSMHISNNLIISDTTRPQRTYEQNGIAYNFIDVEDFIHGVSYGEYLEYTKFRGWYYGIHKSEIQDVDVNIAIVNPQGLRSLIEYKKQYQIIPVYLKDRLLERLLRSRDREGKWRLEYFRRAISDWFTFLRINSTLKKFPRTIILKNENGVVRKTRKIINALRSWRIIAAG